jgi:hypothetical protein
MLKLYGYDGVYRDDNITVSVLLENPREFNIKVDAIAFSVMMKDKNGDILPSDDFTFYVTDEANIMYNTRQAPYLIPDTDAYGDDDEPVSHPHILIYTDFRPEFLFQDIRVAFYYCPIKKIRIIDLEH